MACTYPIIAYEIIGEKTKKGKSVIKFKRPDDKPYKIIEIRCGQCLMCRIEKAKEWQKRIIAERSMYEENYFITLTYDEEHLPSKEMVKINIDLNTGEILEMENVVQGTLVKQDVTDFKKRLLEHFRRKKHKGIRFYYAGEYGPQTQRPHYHLIMFNLPLYDLEFWKLNKQGMPMYISKTVEKLWGKGFVTIGTVTYESAGYVARYVLKKQKSNVIYEGREKEFTQMSTRGGIGKGYYEKNKDKIYKNDSMLIPKELSSSYFTKPPKYFDEMYNEEEMEEFYKIKLERRKMAQNARDVNDYENRTSLNWHEQRELEERAVARKMVNLTREL